MPTSRELVEPSGARAGRTNRMLAQDGLPLETGVNGIGRYCTR
jgi:hypothetical protein